MAKINRYNGDLKAFASQAQGTERTVFGDTVQSDTLDANITADWLRGWGIVGVNENPTKQDFNGLAFTLGQLLAYLHQMGVPEWNASQEYHIGSVATTASGIYRSLTANNTGIDPDTDDGTNWEKGATQQAVNERTIFVGSVAELINVSGATAGAQYCLAAYHPDSDYGGGVFYWDAARSKADHNGGTIIDPDRPFPADWSNDAQLSDWFSSAASGTGCFIKVDIDEVSIEDFGASLVNTSIEKIMGFYIPAVRKARIFNDVAGASDPSTPLVRIDQDNYAFEGDFVSKVSSLEDLSSPIGVFNIGEPAKQKDVTISSAVLQAIEEGTTNDYPALQLWGIDGGLIFGSRFYGRCGVNVGYFNVNPDQHTRDDIRTSNSVVSNNLINSWDLGYEVFSTQSCVVSSSAIIGTGTETEGSRQGQGIRLTAYGASYNTAFSPPASREVDMQGRSNVLSSMTIDNKSRGVTVQAGIQSNIVNAVTVANCDLGFELFPQEESAYISDKNIYSSINVRDCASGISDYGTSKTICSDFIISNFKTYGFYEDESAGNLNEYRIRRVNGIVTESDPSNTTRVSTFRSSNSTYDITAGDFENNYGILFTGNSNKISVVASDFRRANAAVEIEGNNNIIDLVISDINTTFAVVNILGNNNVVRVNLIESSGSAAYMEVVGEGNVVTGIARILGNPPASNSINVNGSVAI